MYVAAESPTLIVILILPTVNEPMACFFNTHWPTALTVPVPLLEPAAVAVKIVPTIAPTGAPNDCQLVVPRVAIL